VADADVVVVGGGNAALCAAIAARQAGRSVVVLERAPYRERGGNSAFTTGAMRVAYRGVEDLRRIMPDLSDEDVARSDFGSYPREAFFETMGKVTGFRTDPDLAALLVDRSLETLVWMREQGVRFLPSYGRQAFLVDGRYRFWGGLAVEAVGGGEGLIDSLTRAASAAGAEIRYGARATSLVTDDRAVRGVRVRRGLGTEVIEAPAVILACGGFEANAEWRARYLGPGWELARVRGTRHNTGDGIRMALEAGAMPYGNWSGCHAVAWDLNAPEFGDLKVRDNFQKHSYPLGIMVNAHGRRFVDEGADFRNYTYARYGRIILEQPNQVAWQIFDAKVSHLLRDEYRIRQVTKYTSPTLEGLAQAIEGIDRNELLRTIAQYNASVRRDVPFNPAVLDGRCTVGLDVPKSNWANTIDTPPFEAYAVTCGITFTFGGLRVNERAQVVDEDGDPIPGLYACGELVGGLFYFNYPGGTGLTAGSVLGRIAGAAASAR